MREPRLGVLLVVLAVLGLGACGGRSDAEQARARAAAEKQARRQAAREFTSFHALPAGARVVVGADVGKLAASPVVRHAFRTMLARERGLASQLETLQTRCQVDVSRDLNRVIVALMGDSSERDVLLLAEGRLDEAAIVACVRAQLADEHGQVTARQGPAPGHVRYHVVSSPGAAEVFLAFPAPGTLLVADGEALLLRALDPAGAKLADDQATMALVGCADVGAALWGAGKVDPAVGQGLLAATDGKVTAPAEAMWGHVRLGDRLELELVLDLASEADARAAAAAAQAQIERYAVIAQGHGGGLGALVHGIKARARPTGEGGAGGGGELVLTLTLDAAALAKLEDMLDNARPSAEGQGVGQGASP